MYASIFRSTCMDQYNDQHIDQYLINTKNQYLINIYQHTWYSWVKLLLYDKFRYLFLFVETAERDVKQSNTNRSQSELDEVTTDKNKTPIQQSKATDVTQLSQQFLPDLANEERKIETNITLST